MPAGPVDTCVGLHNFYKHYGCLLRTSTSRSALTSRFSNNSITANGLNVIHAISYMGQPMDSPTSFGVSDLPVTLHLFDL